MGGLVHGAVGADVDDGYFFVVVFFVENDA